MRPRPLVWPRPTKDQLPLDGPALAATLEKVLPK
jgi:hypothetical protein